MFVVGMMIAATVLWIWAFFHAVRVPHDSMFASGSKLLWAIVIGLGGPIGAVIYLTVGRPRVAF
jgi:hypothetical protein